LDGRSLKGDIHILSTEEFELTTVDKDIGKYLKKIGCAKYRLGFPLELQLVRCLRELNCNLVTLIKNIPNSKASTDNSGKSNSAIQPKHFTG
jgi:hypothetical protein